MKTGKPAAEPVIHYRAPLGRVLCGRKPAGGSQGVAGNNHERARTTCKECLRRLAGMR